jgi:ribonucleoside-diphosphate reductase alpha chain
VGGHEFYAALEDFRFLPAGRITAGAGTGRQVTLFNCFVMGTIPDTMAGIFDSLKEAALTMQQGGGIGYDFSTIRPAGRRGQGRGGRCQRAAVVHGCLGCDVPHHHVGRQPPRRDDGHHALRPPRHRGLHRGQADPARLRMFNLSVLVTDAFMAAVKADGPWELVFGGKVYKTVQARDLWNRIMRSTFDYAEPGVIFIDRINAMNNLAYAETIAATNPCGEQPCRPMAPAFWGRSTWPRWSRMPLRRSPAWTWPRWTGWSGWPCG